MHSRRWVLGRALLVLVWLFATTTSVYVVALALDPAPFWGDVPQSARVPGILFSVAILALNVSFVVLKVREVVKGEGSQYLLSRTSEGTARISLRAIQASLQRRVKDLEDIIGVRLAVRRPAVNRLRIEVSYTTTEDQNAIQVSERLRRSLRERFREIVHTEEDFELEFDVKIDGFVPASGGAEAQKPEAEQEPFTGPRYPID